MSEETQKLQEQMDRVKSDREAEVQYLDVRLQASHREVRHLHADNDAMKQKIAELETANEVLVNTIKNLRQQVRDIQVNRTIPGRA